MTSPQTPESILSGYFGPFAVPTWKLLPSIEAGTRRQAYTFLAPDAYDVLAREQPLRAQAIYWRETILRVHLACCASLRRHRAWLDVLFTAIERDSLFGTYAACRGFLESAADSYYSVGPTAKTLAAILPLIRANIKEKPTDRFPIVQELEDRLIHFSHGRKLERKEIADPSHAAKQMREYLEEVKQVGVTDVHALYSELCSISHPSSETVLVWFNGSHEGDEVIWRHTEIDQRKIIEAFMTRWKETNEGVFNAAFVPTFMSLRLLHKIDFLPKIPELKAFPLESFPAWKEIERQITK